MIGTFCEELFAFLKNKTKKYLAWMLFANCDLFSKQPKQCDPADCICRDGKKIVRGVEAATLSELEAIFCPCIDLWIGFMVLPKDW